MTRIAPYRPFGVGELQIEFARREFVLAAAHENGGGFSSLADVQIVCKGLWGMDLDIDEIRSVTARLVSAGKLSNQGGRFELTAGAGQDLAERVRVSSEVEALAFNEWEQGVRDIAPKLDDTQIGDLRDDLALWLQEIITQHGIEAALLLYPEQERALQLLDEIEKLGFDFLPEREDDVAVVRPKALYAFIHVPTAAQRTYLANLMTTAYLMSVFTLDPAAHAVVQTITSGQRVYLDTNVVYAILNLSGPRAFMSVRRMLDLTRQLGYEVSVTPWTVAEMQESARRARAKLARTQLPPRALAEIAAETSGDETFITAYWRKYKETGVTADDFLDLHEQIVPLLEKAGIAVVDTSCVAIDRARDVIADQVSLLETIPGGAEKIRPLQEHDVKHRLLIERLRGTSNRRFSNAGCWFLTRDRVLVPYASAGRSRSDEMPFAVSLAAWAHIVRSLCPRTNDYEQTMVDLLDTPSVRPRGVVSQATVAQVLGRIDMLVQDSSEEIATRLLLDTAVMDQVEAKDPAVRERFIDTAIEQKKAEMERQLRETQEQVARERAARQVSEASVRAVNEELAREREARAEVERRAAALDQARAEHEQLAATRLVDAEAAAQEAIAQKAADAQRHSTEFAELSQRIARQERISRQFVAVLIAIIGVAVAAVPIVTGWITGGWPLVGIVCGGGGILLGAVAWLYGRKKASSVAAGIGLVLGIIVSVQTIVTSTDHPSSSSTTVAHPK